MATSRRDGNYRSFDYLDDDPDFHRYELAGELDRVPATEVELTAEEADRARRVADESLMISMHDHPNRFPDEIAQTPRYIRDGHISTAYEGLAHSSWSCVFTRTSS